MGALCQSSRAIPYIVQVLNSYRVVRNGQVYAASSALEAFAQWLALCPDELNGHALLGLKADIAAAAPVPPPSPSPPPPQASVFDDASPPPARTQGLSLLDALVARGEKQKQKQKQTASATLPSQQPVVALSRKAHGAAASASSSFIAW